MNTQKEIKLTIAIPVYNTASYLEETFLCVENQTLGIENMEIILVNDGSIDSSSEICQEFQKRHIKNVHYVEFPENQGVSCAKNTALDMAKGKYITFWDSDDLWSLNAMEESVAFLSAHEEEIDLVSANIEFFDSFTRPHVLNFHVSENTIIDIQKEYQKIRTVGPDAVIRTETAKKFRFDESQARWEDAKYMNQLLLQKKKYGMLANAKFYYRRRKSNDSATQSFRGDKKYFLYELNAFLQGIYEESLEQCGELLPIMQYLSAYTIGSYFSESTSLLNEEEQEQYDIIRKKILSHIEDRYIKEIPNIDQLVKWKMLAFKHGLELEDEIDTWSQQEQSLRWSVSRLNRTTANYNALKQWFTLKQQDKSVRLFFERNEYNRIAVYGLSDLGLYLIEELKDSPVQVIYGIDRRAEKLAVSFPVLTSEDTLPPVDVIVVTAVYFFEEINAQLQKKVTCPVISLEDVLYTVE